MKPRRHVGGIHNLNKSDLNAGIRKFLQQAYSLTVYFEWRIISLTTHVVRKHTLVCGTTLHCCNMVYLQHVGGNKWKPNNVTVTPSIAVTLTHNFNTTLIHRKLIAKKTINEFTQNKYKTTTNNYKNRTATLAVCRTYRHHQSLSIVHAGPDLAVGGPNTKICGVPIFMVDVDHGGKLDYVRT